MIGCLTLPLRLLGLLLILLVVAGGWLYRDRIVEEVRGLTRPAAPAATGVPTSSDLREARAKVASLGPAGADSVVLGPNEAASLVAAGLDPVLRERLDSLEVRLGSGRIAVSGVVATGRLPAGLVGPLSVVLRDRERVTVGGPLAVAAPEQAAWAIDELALRGVPLPRDAVPDLLQRALGGGADGAVSVRIPAAVRALRIEPQRVILFRDTRP